MTLPEVHSDDVYNRADVIRRLSEWVFSSTSYHVPSHTSEVVTFAVTPTLPSPPNSPRSPRDNRRPTPLDLKGDDNFIPPQALHSILRAPATPDKPISPGLPTNNVFCLSGPAKSGKTQLAARMCEWLIQLKCLGGYFTFDGGSQRSLDSLPITLIHQIVTTERDSFGSFRKALNADSDALKYPLEQRFEMLFVDPLRDFVAGRTNARWNPLDPLVFIIDGIGSGSENEDSTMARMLVNLICSSGFGKLPGFVKFVVFVRSETEVERLLKEKGVDVLEMGPGSLPMEVNGVLSNGGRWPINSSNRTLLTNQI